MEHCHCYVRPPSPSTQDEFKAAASQILCLKEAINFTERCACLGLGPQRNALSPGDI